MRSRLLAVTALLAAFLAVFGVVRDARDVDRPPPVVPLEDVARPTPTAATPARMPRPRVVWRRSVAIGDPSAGRLLRAVRLPARGEGFVTWDPTLKQTPNRWWRRNGTDRLVRVLLQVTRHFAASHPRAPRVLIGDLSRPHGGDFGRRYGPLGHVSHQNGLDADVYFPRRDRRERAARSAAQVDLRLAQDLVDRFVRAGAQRVFVGPSLGLHGPAGVVEVLAHHDDHLHVRFEAGT